MTGRHRGVGDGKFSGTGGNLSRAVTVDVGVVIEDRAVDGRAAENRAAENRAAENRAAENRAIDGILRRQGGVISREQAVAAGLSPAVIDQWLRRRRWCPLHPRVYLAAGHPGGPEARIRAAVLWAGDGAVLSGVAAAWWFGMVDRAPHRITLTVNRPGHARARVDVVVRRRRLAAEDVTEVRGVGLTALPLTVLEAALELGAGGRPLLDRALQRWTPFPAVDDARRRYPGVQGSLAAERMLSTAADRSAAAARRLLKCRLRESGATGWCSGVTVAGYAVDVAFPAVRVAIDAVGWARRQDAEHERVEGRRRRALDLRGWTLLQVDWAELVSGPWDPLARVAGAGPRCPLPSRPAVADRPGSNR